MNSSNQHKEKNILLIFIPPFRNINFLYSQHLHTLELGKLFWFNKKIRTNKSWLLLTKELVTVRGDMITYLVRKKSYDLYVYTYSLT